MTAGEPIAHRVGGRPDQSLQVPPATWQLLDLDPRTRDKSMERLVRRAVGNADRLARVRHEAVVAYRRMASDAADRGGVPSRHRDRGSR